MGERSSTLWARLKIAPVRGPHPRRVITPSQLAKSRKLLGEKQARAVLYIFQPKTSDRVIHVPGLLPTMIALVGTDSRYFPPNTTAPIRGVVTSPELATGSSSTRSPTSSSLAQPRRKPAIRLAQQPRSDAAARNGSPQGSSLA